MHPEPDDFPPFLIHNGTLRKAGSEVLPIEDGAPARGHGAFETIAAYHGRPFLAVAHLGRLRRAAARLDLDCPPDHVFLDAIGILLSANRLDQEAKARIRLTLTAPPQRGASWFIEAGPVPPHGIAARVVTIPYARNERGALSGLKTISYGENAVAMQLARAAGADEALFANTRDELCEGTWSNIFLYSKGSWLTPPLSSGCLPGVTRALVLELLGELGLAAKEVTIPMTDLPAAEGAFLTSSLREIQTIMAIDARELPESPDLASLREAFAERVGRETGPAPA